MEEKKKAIGSFFALELPAGSDFYHNQGIRLNTGRNAFEYILFQKKVKTIFLPYYSCDALITPLKRLNIEYKFYHINTEFYPDIDLDSLGNDTFLLYINYFGLFNSNIFYLVDRVQNLIVDNTQAFFCQAYPGIPTFYSARKFFGVSDGAFLLNTGSNEIIDLELDKSEGRMRYLLSRIENEPEVAYKDYKIAEMELDNLPLRYMSALTERLLSVISYAKIRNIRNKNFETLNTAFKELNGLKCSGFNSPLCYPLWIVNGAVLKDKLIKKRIFIPTFWPNVLTNRGTSAFERSLAEDLIPIPIDQRYSIKDMRYIIKEVKSLIC